MRDCIEALGDYAALVGIDNRSSSKATEIRDLIGTIVSYWGLDYGEGSKSADDYLQEFNDKVYDAVRSGFIEVDTYSACSDALTGLAQYGEDMNVAHGGDEFAMKEMLRTGDLLNEIADYFGYPHETVFANDSARWLNNSVKGMLKDYKLPGNAVEGDNVHNYAVKQAVLYDNNVGFAFAHNPEAVSPYVTWRTFNDNGKINYEWGHYFNSEEKALVDYISRSNDYKLMENVKEIPITIAESAKSQNPEIPKNKIPVYMGSLPEAFEKGEKPKFVESQKLNVECGQAIDAALSARSTSGEMAGTQYVDTKQAAQDVINEYGMERVAFVLAGNVKAAEYDGRWSKATKEWANSTDAPSDTDYHLNTHRTILDSFVDKFRKLQLEAEVWPLYKAEIYCPDEPEFPHLEVFSARDDADAIKHAYQLENDEEGAILLELHELDENYNAIREVGLLADPTLRRFMDVDLIDFLGKIADKVIIHYPQDFQLDVDTLWKVALTENPAEQRLMWHVGGYGTHTLPEDEVFTKSTGSHGYWVDYRPNDEDMMGYVVEVTGYDNQSETVIGNVYEVGDYANHANYVRENSLPLDAVSLTYAKDWGINAGKTVTVPRYEYDNARHRLMSESGNVTDIKYHPSESVITMDERLKSEQQKRMCMQIGKPEEHLKKIDAKLAEIRGVPEQAERHTPFADKEVNKIIADLENKITKGEQKPTAKDKAVKPKKPKKPSRGEDR